eukprot:scaffold25459_cov30-Tisochrysis_lutea.AAC.1
MAGVRAAPLLSLRPPRRAPADQDMPQEGERGEREGGGGTDRGRTTTALPPGHREAEALGLVRIRNNTQHATPLLSFIE